MWLTYAVSETVDRNHAKMGLVVGQDTSLFLYVQYHSSFLYCYCLGTEDAEMEEVGKITDKALVCKDRGFPLK